MDLTFNELSLNPIATNTTDAYCRMHCFVKIYKKSEPFGFNKIRFKETFSQIRLCEELTLDDFCKIPTNRTIGTLLRGLARYPFIDDNSVEEDRYIESDFFIEKDGQELRTYGLAAAYLYNTIAIGFQSCDFWKKHLHTLKIASPENQRNESILCLSDEKHLCSDEFIKWKENTSPIELVEDNTPSSKKHMELRDDHGIDTLTKFSKRILTFPYVRSVINSLPFNPYDTKFIRRVYPTGKIEIVLTNTDEGLGIIIQTTGRNKRETEKIAEILSQTYG